MNARSAIACAALLAACGAQEQAPPRPDVVLVVFDTLRADRLPFYVDEERAPAVASAPFLGALARESVVFERAWAPSSWTTPSMASLFTSVYPDQHNLWSGIATMDAPQSERPLSSRLPSALETIPELMRALGYRTFGLSDNPHVCELEGFEPGFERFHNADYAGAEALNEVLRGWSAEIRAAEPRFVFLHYMDPHAPYHRRKPWFERPPEDGDPDKTALKLEAYDSEIDHADAFLREAFELAGVDEDTLVIFTADHGEEFGDHGGWSHLFQLYSELTNVPLLVRLPRAEPAPAARRVRANVSLVDLLPTLRELLGAPPSEQDAGHSLVPLLAGEARGDGERAVFSMRLADRAAKRAVIQGDLKLIETRSAVDPTRRVHELYDLAADPGERRDLAAERPQDVTRLAERLQRFLDEATVWEPEAAAATADPQKLERLRALGYTGEAATTEDP